MKESGRVNPGNYTLCISETNKNKCIRVGVQISSWLMTHRITIKARLTDKSPLILILFVIRLHHYVVAQDFKAETEPMETN